MSKCLRRLLILFLLIGTSQAGADALFSINDAWVREAPPTARIMAGYMELRNAGDSAITVISISSPDFTKTEIHRTVIEDGIARMLPVGQLEIPANSRIKLEPGGLHMMLFDPQRPLAEGATVNLMLHRDEGNDITVAAPVIRFTGEDHSSHH